MVFDMNPYSTGCKLRKDINQNSIMLTSKNYSNIPEVYGKRWLSKYALKRFALDTKLLSLD